MTFEQILLGILIRRIRLTPRWYVKNGINEECQEHLIQMLKSAKKDKQRATAYIHHYYELTKRDPTNDFKQARKKASS